MKVMVKGHELKLGRYALLRNGEILRYGVHRAMKGYRCEYCEKDIKPGEAYFRVSLWLPNFGWDSGEVMCSQCIGEEELQKIVQLQGKEG